MDVRQILSAIVGFSISFYFCLPKIEKWQRQQIIKQKLRIVSEALDEAEDRVARFQERYDRLLIQIGSSFFITKEQEEALNGARAAMNEALEFLEDLISLQLQIISSFPEEVEPAGADWRASRMGRHRRSS